MKTQKTLDELAKYTDISKYDINARVQMIVDEIQMKLKQWEDEARAVYWTKEQE